MKIIKDLKIIYTSLFFVGIPLFLYILFVSYTQQNSETLIAVIKEIEGSQQMCFVKDSAKNQKQNPNDRFFVSCSGFLE